MDDDSGPALKLSQRAAVTQGGTVEPANRATVAKDRFQTPVDAPVERFELRDPFAEVTYRTSNLQEIEAKAEQLGSNRFVALDPEGRRTTVQKVDGTWQRGPQRPAQPERPVEVSAFRDDVPQVGDKEKQSPAPESDAKAIARLDARAERTALVERLKSALLDRYIIKRAPVQVGEVTIGRTEYRFRGDTSRLAFTESTFKLATDTNSPSVARSMVDVAEARNWRALRVSGHEDFRRMVWLEASVRGVKTVGYEPNPADLQVLQKEREARLVNRIEPERGVAVEASASPRSFAATDKPSARGGGGRKAVLAAIEAVLVAKGVPEQRREAVMAAATEKLAQRIRDGQTPKVKVYDKAAPSQRPAMPVPEVQRARERAAPAR